MTDGTNKETNVTAWTDADFDRLVDGELPPEEYRRLLASLEKSPDGWRRLGCAFLEGQAWRQELAPTPTHAELPEPQGRWWMRPAPQWLALAASLMLVFAFGTQIDRAWNSISRPAANSIAGTHEARTSATGTADSVNRATPAPTLAQSRSSAGSDPRGTVVQPAPQTLGNVRVMLSRPDGNAEPTELPVFDGRDVDPDQIWKFSSPLPEDVVEKLEASGQQVVTQRHYIPVHLEDGRTIVIPVERIQLIPRTTY